MKRRGKKPSKPSCCGHAVFDRVVVSGLTYCRCVHCVTMWLELPLVPSEVY